VSDLLKHRYSPVYVARLGAAVAEAWPKFDARAYQAAVLGDGWSRLELKQRMRRLSFMLHRFLPVPYAKQIGVLRRVAPSFGGLEGMLFPDFVEQFGLEEFETSVDALEFFTQFSSSEFAVRPFLVHYGKRMVAMMRRWTAHESEHVRRLASEGTRPRLPWAMALPAFKKDPSPALPILEALKADPSDYVRRSVANHLNDIAKDHPELVLEIAGAWLGKNPATDALVKHACRTLLKRGDARTLALFGFGRPASVRVRTLRLSTSRLRIGEDLQFRFEVRHQEEGPLALRLEYAVDFVKANGKTSRKVFQISEGIHAPNQPRTFERKHRFRDFTTRRHYHGDHRLSILVNGQVSAQTTVRLCLAR
jgi:3-methyladenine DNA glycosylase AlkC